VTHAAIAENKHQGAVLAHIKEEQEKVARRDDHPKWKHFMNADGLNEQLKADKLQIPQYSHLTMRHSQKDISWLC